jgi:hypothetical protein
VLGTLGYLPQTNLNTNLSWRKEDLHGFLMAAVATENLKIPKETMLIFLQEISEKHITNQFLKAK